MLCPGFIGRTFSGAAAIWKFTGMAAPEHTKSAKNRADGVARSKRGIPRIRPPFPRRGRVWRPTVINNAETLANVPTSSRWRGLVRQAGHAENGGTRLFCLSGNIAKPGVYELPMGYN